ncbi:hypothetical protein Rs2_41168 [Raphanus sativus]|nr:hypothetical protein Rs2_41168 [Raphanus sativus]
MDPTQIQLGNSRQGVTNVDSTGSHPRNETSPIGLTNTTGTETSQKQRVSLTGTAETSVPGKTGASVCFPRVSSVRQRSDRPGETNNDDLTNPMAQTREQVAELTGMVATLVDKSRDQELPYRTIAAYWWC